MSYYRNYRKPYYHRRRRYTHTDPIDPVKGIFLIGIAFIVFGSISVISSGNIGSIIGKIITWGVVFYGAIFLFKKIRNKFNHSKTSDSNVTPDSKIINSEKHGCKCYMEELTEGERIVANILAKELDYKDYFLFNNLTIPSSQNGSSQIDHLVISKFGIFVIENKNYKGWIFGNKNQDEWTQSLPGGKKFQFQNPIHQNWSHIMSLRTLLPFVPEDAFQSIVVFTDSCEFKTEPIDNVLHSENIVEYILKNETNKLSEDNLQLILGKLSYTCQTIDVSPSQHIENLKNKHNS
jgi:restriction system protein